MTYKIEYISGEFVIDNFDSDDEALDYYAYGAYRADEIDIVTDIQEVDEDYNIIRVVY